jgi:hypothetical protein
MNDCFSELNNHLFFLISREIIRQRFACHDEIHTNNIDSVKTSFRRSH